MQVFLCEKPSQGRDIAKVLGVSKRSDGFISGNKIIVTWCIGHLLETAPPESYGSHFKQWNLASLPILPAAWKMEAKKQTAKQLAVVKKCISQASEVVIATDADREGESIAREVLDLCKFKGSVSRLWFSALDEASLKKALANKMSGEKTYPLYLAGLARSRADWLVGMNLTRLFTILGQQAGYDGVLSVGRVQTPTLKLVVDRDLEIENFQPKPYWEVEIDLSIKDTQFKSKWVVPEEQADEAGRCINKALANQVCQAVINENAQLIKLDEKQAKENAPLLFDLGSLQQEASRRWGMGAKQVLDIAQALYETHKLTTYPRTDCGYLPKSMLSEVKAVVNALIKTDSSINSLTTAADLNKVSRVWNDAKITAHHGIIPTMAAGDISKLSADELKIYDAIRLRYLAQFYPEYNYLKTEALFSCKEHKFISKGSSIIQLGWKQLFTSEKNSEKDNDETSLPKLAEGDLGPVVDAKTLEKMTQPPQRFAEGTLIAAMKNAARYVTDERLKKMLKDTAGIGTEATRASIIETLFNRQYLKKQGKHIISTDTARSLIAALPIAVKDPGTTALWEQALEEIAQGKRGLDEFMQRQEAWIKQLVDRFNTTSLDIKVEAAKFCPECKKPMRKRKGANGQFWGCTGYPDCKTTVDMGTKKKSYKKTASKKRA